MKYIPTIGLEVHTELKTESKMFCSCKNDPLEKQPNVNICPICMGHPGTLPFPNEKAIHQVIKAGLALNCTIAEHSKFDRKNYFYPDLPKGYQISQYDMPLASKGYLQIGLPAGEAGERNISITRIHLEEDTGRSQHPEGTDYSLVDFNRAGIPLMELVTEPDIQSAKEASAFAQELQMIFRYLGISDADMEKGQMRVEANVSVRPEGTDKLGTKVEVKNLNSFRAVEESIEYEINRQTQVLSPSGRSPEGGDAGEEVQLETRGWSESKGETFSQRAKEEAHDYRYFPEPDIPPLTFTPEFIEKLRLEIPELPQTRKARMQKEYNLTDKEVSLLTKDKELGEYFEQVVSELGPHLSKEELVKRVKLSVNYIVSDLQGLLQGISVEHKDFKITAENFAELINMIADGKISSPAAKALLKKMFETGGDPSQLLESEGLAQVSDESQIEAIARDIIAKNPKAVQDYKKGKANALQFLLGQMMSATKSTINPTVAQNLLTQLLDNIK